MKKIYEIPDFEIISFAIKDSILVASPTEPFPTEDTVATSPSEATSPVEPSGPRS